MRKIAIVHGVEIKIPTEVLTTFANNLSNQTGAKCEVVVWNHPGVIPQDPRSDGFFFGTIRNWTHEVVMDAAFAAIQVLTKPDYVLPEADMYVAHSAGGILVSELAKGPRVLMGCPIQLLKNAMVPRTCVTEILNLLHQYDPLAATVTGATNVVIKAPFTWRWIGPQLYVMAHTSYWENPLVVTQCADWFKRAYPEG